MVSPNYFGISFVSVGSGRVEVSNSCKSYYLLEGCGQAAPQATPNRRGGNLESSKWTSYSIMGGGGGRGEGRGVSWSHNIRMGALLLIHCARSIGTVNSVQ